MKYIRVGIVVLAVVLSVFLAMPGLLDADNMEDGTLVENLSTNVPVPTPDYHMMEPVYTATPVPTLALALTPTPEPTQEPVADEGKPAYVLDLWLDASPNMAGLSPFDSSKDYKKQEDGQWLGGFFYNATVTDKMTQTAWMPKLLNMLYDKNMTGQQGDVRVLRMAAESVLPQRTLEGITTNYEVDRNALIRDMLTYDILADNSRDHSTFFHNVEDRKIRTGLLKISGYLDPGSSNPYAINDCFFTPNTPDENNRTISVQESVWNWQRETAHTEALSMASTEMTAAFNSYHTRLLSQASVESGTADSASPDDYLYYALSAMDVSHLNVMVIDTLSLPEIDTYSDLYVECIRRKAQENNGDLSVGIMAVQLDYAGKISNLGGNILRYNGFLWGYENYQRMSQKNTTYRWRFVQPMPRPVLLLVIGTTEQVNTYTEQLCALLDTEMAPGGVFSETKVDASLLTQDDEYEEKPAFFFQGQNFLAPKFNFKYRCTVMNCMNVVEQQLALLTMLSEQLSAQDEPLFFISNNAIMPTEEYEYHWTEGALENTATIPIVTTNFGEPITLALDMHLSEDDTFSASTDQYDTSITVVSGMQTRSFTLDEIDAMNRSGEMDVSANSIYLSDQAYVSENDRVYKFHPLDDPQETLPLQHSPLTVVNGELRVTLATNEVPAPGYYWVTFEMRSKALTELDNANWNPIAEWMTPAAEVTFDEGKNPTDLANFGHSWDYTPNNYALRAMITADRALGKPNKTNFTTIIPSNVNNGSNIHHAWGIDPVLQSNEFPANIPPVFRLFQLNRLTTCFRNGLLDRTGGEIDSASFLTRHFIICVPEATTVGEN